MKRKLDPHRPADDRHSAVILDWSQAFAARVMSRIHEYDDDWPKPFNTNTIIRFERCTARRANRR
ncbi:hypothetical protein [Mesorhizobium sp. P5_C1]